MNANRINEIGDTVKGQEMLGRTAERAYQRANRTSGADKNRYMKTYNDAYRTGSKSANKHLGGSREHFDNGRDYEHEKWADEHNGNVTESKNMNKKLIRLTENDLHKIVKESVNRVMKEGVEFSSEDPQEEWMYYQYKLQQEFDELGIMVLNKIPRNDPDRQIIQRYIRMIQTHLHTLEN